MDLLEKIESLGVSDDWKAKFRTLAEVGEPITYSMRLRNEAVYKQLPFKIKFNIWAFLFGIFYYLSKGMWKKGLTIIGIGIAMTVVITVLFGGEAGNIASLVVYSLLFATFASFDYYRTMVLAEDFWI
ncbi:MAG: DUF2628 domain-containing protein [Sulfuricurvum sp.]|nr:DUF2628 domain-containing protein [Sulfuricurvum sp.]